MSQKQLGILLGIVSLFVAAGFEMAQLAVSSTVTTVVGLLIPTALILLIFQGTRSFAKWFLFSYFFSAVIAFTVFLITGANLMMLQYFGAQDETTTLPEVSVIEESVPEVSEIPEVFETPEVSETTTIIPVEPVESDDQSSSDANINSPLVTETERTEVHKNWDHIAKSLTQYLMWSGKKVALVEHCLDGYEKIYEKGNYTCKGSVYDDNRWMEFEWLDGRRIKAPEDLSQHFLMDFNNFGGSGLQYLITPDENHMIYLDFWSDDETRVVSLDMANAKKETLMSFLPSSNGACNGERFFGMNQSRTKLGIVIANEGVYGQYPNSTKVFILTIEDGKLIKKSNYIIRVLADCTPNNGPFFAVGWIDDDTIGYYDPNDNPYNDHTKDDYNPEYLESFFYGEDRWGSKYARFYDVD